MESLRNYFHIFLVRWYTCQSDLAELISRHVLKLWTVCIFFALHIIIIITLFIISIIIVYPQHKTIASYSWMLYRITPILFEPASNNEGHNVSQATDKSTQHKPRRTNSHQQRPGPWTILGAAKIFTDIRKC